MKHIILADVKSGPSFEVPRQLTEINGEKLVCRTIRLLKENGVNDILVTSHDKRFDNLGAERYEPKFNDYDAITKTGYWLSAFPIELLDEPVCFIWGDVYYSEEAIKTIVNTETESTLFFCTRLNKSIEYIKKHDEPLAYKVVDGKLFKEHIDKVKRLYDEGKTCRHPIVWELYRSINGQDINVHEMTNNYVAINDITCDIDSVGDIMLLNQVIGGKYMIEVKATEEFTLSRFKELKNIKRANPEKDEEGQLHIGDIFECTKEMGEYLTGKNDKKKVVVEVIKIIPYPVIKTTKTSKSRKTKK